MDAAATSKRAPPASSPDLRSRNPRILNDFRSRSGASGRSSWRQPRELAATAPVTIFDEVVLPVAADGRVARTMARGLPARAQAARPSLQGVWRGYTEDPEHAVVRHPVERRRRARRSSPRGPGRLRPARDGLLGSDGRTRRSAGTGACSPTRASRRESLGRAGLVPAHCGAGEVQSWLAAANVEPWTHPDTSIAASLRTCPAASATATPSGICGPSSDSRRRAFRSVSD